MMVEQGALNINESIAAQSLPIVERFKGALELFLGNAKQIVGRKNCPAWFTDFSKHLETFSNETATTLMELEASQEKLQASLAVQKAVTDGLVENRKSLEKRIAVLETDLEDLRQYSRRTNLLIHGVDEEANECTDDKVLDIIQTKLNVPLTINDVSRTHRLGKPADGKKRPIIIRFVSHRQKKMVYDAKKKLKGTRTVVTENLTKERYSLYKQCIEKCGMGNVWTFDGRIYCLTGRTDRTGRKERKVVTRKEDLNF